MAVLDIFDDLVEEWQLNETSGRAVGAWSGIDLSDTNTVGSGTGLVYATARDFEASNSEYFPFPACTETTMGDIDFTIEAWVKLESLSNGTIVGKWTTAGDQREYILYYNASDHSPNNRFSFVVSSTGTSGTTTTLDATTFGAPSTDTWYQVIAKHNAATNQISIRVNAGTADTASHTGGAFAGNREFTIGMLDASPPTYFFDGLIGPVRIWKRLTSDAEDTWLYNSGAGRVINPSNDWQVNRIAYEMWTAGTRVLGGPNDFSSCPGAFMANRLALNDGDTVSPWVNEGSGADATATNTSTFETNELNGMPVVRFGATSYFDFTITADATVTALLVAKKRSAADSTTRGMLTWGTSSAAIYQDTDDGSGWLYGPNAAAGVEVLGGSVAEWSLVSIRFNSTSSCDPSVNGYSAGNFDPDNAYSSQTSLRIGAVSTTGADWDCPEFLFFDSALSDGNWTTAQRYLSAKYLIGPSARLEDAYAAAIWAYATREETGGGGDVTISLSALVGNGTLIAPIVTTGVTLAPSPLSGIGTLVAPSVTGTVTILPDPLVGNGVLVATTATTGVTLDLSALVGNGTLVAPVVTTGVTIPVGPLVANGTLVAPVAFIGTLVYPDPLSGIGTVTTQTVTVGTSLSLSPLTGYGTLVAPTVNTGVTLAPNPLSGSGSLTAPTIASLTAVTLSPLSGVANPVTASLSVGTSLLLSALVGRGTIVSIAVVGGTVTLPPIDGFPVNFDFTESVSVNFDYTETIRVNF